MALDVATAMLVRAATREGVPVGRNDVRAERLKTRGVVLIEIADTAIERDPDLAGVCIFHR